MNKIVCVYETTNDLDLERAYDWLVDHGIECSKITNSFNNLYGFNRLGGALENISGGHRLMVSDGDRYRAEVLIKELFEGAGM
ncbi:MAG: hypothetical protein JW874_16170 [Spirochaetales bacterium]|nr:hypothetical protein [Spirochaetales bacterium]